MMTAILQLPGAKRTCLLGKISSNLRPLKLEFRPARLFKELFFSSSPRVVKKFDRWANL